MAGESRRRLRRPSRGSTPASHSALAGVAVSGFHDRWPRTHGADRVVECAARTTATAVSIGIEIMRTHDRGRPHIVREAIGVVRLRPHHGTHYDVSVVGGRRPYDVRVEKAYDVKSAINIEAVRDRTKTVDLKQVNRVLLQPHWRENRDAA